MSVQPAASTGIDRWDAHLRNLRETVSLHASQPASADARLHARRLLLDTLGCALAGRHAQPVRRLESLCAATGSGFFALPGGPAMDLHAAAQVLAMAATWDEACEGHALAHGRPGVPLVAALLPLSIARGASVEQYLDAFVLGYEVGARAGAWLRIRPGMHVDANWPALGVAAGVARLLGLDAAGISQAVDIAACQISTSLYLPVATGKTARNTYLGHSATLGLQSAFASAAGIDAPQDAISHYAELQGSADAAPLPEPGLALLADAYLKPFAAVRHVHYGAFAVRALLEAGPIDHREVTGIRLRVYREALVYCGNRAPATPIQAQFSLSFGLAAMLRFGDIDPTVYETPRFDDAELRRLEALVVLEVDDALTAAQQRGASLCIDAPGGTRGASVRRIAGDAGLPIERQALLDKFGRYASQALDAAPAASFARFVLDGEAEDAGMPALWARLMQAARVPYPSKAATS